MSMLRLRRHSSDNEYLHKDFHASIDNAISYLGDNFGEDAVKEYLSRYVKSRYSRMTLKELNDYFHGIYGSEHFEDSINTELSDDQLTVKVLNCPGIEYFKSIGAKPSKWYRATTDVLYSELAKLCGLDFVLNFYDDETGKSEFVFINKGGK